MTDDSMIAAKAADGFKTESPIRAFTDFQVAGSYAIGKGFRPSLGHLTRYLDAMLSKEGWAVLQVILPRDNDGEPTILFEKGLPSFTDLGLDFVPTVQEGAEKAIVDYVREHGADIKAIIAEQGRPIAKHPALGAPYGLPDDPVNPKHYDGTACAEIGERLSANGYQVLKYCWRLGKKDDPCVELGKALWYLKREFDLIDMLTSRSAEHLMVKPNLRGITAGTANAFLEDRLEGQSTFTANIARMLWEGYTKRRIFSIREAIEEHRFHLECGSGLAI